MEEREHPDVEPGPARVELIGEFLKHEQVRDHDALRRELALIDGRHLLSEKVRKWMDPETFRYIYAGYVLREFQHSPSLYRDVGAEKLAETVRLARQILERHGVQYNSEKDRFEMKPESSRGGRPRQLLRNVVAAWLKCRRENEGHTRNDRDLRRQLASDLAPFFPSHLLDWRDHDGRLKNTVDNASGDS